MFHAPLAGFVPAAPRRTHLRLFLLLLPALLAASAPPAPARNAAGPPRPRTTLAAAPRIAAGYGRLPLQFEPNQGQTDPRVRFLSRTSGGTLFLTDSEAVLVLAGSAKCEVRSAKARPPLRTPHSALRTSGTVLRMKLLGAAGRPTFAAEERLPGVANYFIGKDPKKWRSNIPTYKKARFRGVYPGIDVVYYGSQDGRLEYDFLVAAGADPKRISLAFEGAEKTAVDAAGDLVLHAGGHQVRFRKPRVYQEIAGRQVDVAAGWELGPEFRVQGSGLRPGLAGCDVRHASRIARQSGNRKSKIENRKSAHFHLAAYDRTRPLVIDPVLAYSTCLGGASDDCSLGIAVDGQGCAYVTGYAGSTDFPAVGGTQNHGGAYDAFVAKLSADGTSLAYSTCLGGVDYDAGYGIAVDVQGCAYVVGSTASADFAVVGGTAPPANGKEHVFVTKLAADGALLLYSTCLGGRSNDWGWGIALDALGCAYVTGYTHSADFPITSGGTAPVGNGPADAFVAKLSPVGSSLDYCTCLGGSNEDGGHGIAVDGQGCAYVAGCTWSSDFPVAAGGTAAHGSGPSPPSDAFVAKFSPAGTSVAYSTCLGGASWDYGNGIAVDAQGGVYVTGSTVSPDFPVTVGGAPSHGDDAFVARLSWDGTAPVLVYSTCLGYGHGNSIVVDPQGCTYVTGAAGPGFPVTVGGTAHQGVLWDAFVVKLSADGASLIRSTCLGGATEDQGYGIAVDGQGCAYVTGFTNSPDYPITEGCTAYNDMRDAFVTKLLANWPPALACQHATVTVNEGATAGNTGTWGDTDGDVVTLTASPGTLTQNADGTWAWSLATADGPTQSQTVTITADDGHGNTPQAQFALTVNNVAPAVTAPAEQGAVPGVAHSFSLGSFADPGADASWTVDVDWGDGSAHSTPPPMGSAGTLPSLMHTYAAIGDRTVTVKVTDKDGGVGDASFTVHIQNPPSLSIDDVSQAEGNSGTTPLIFTVSLSAASAETVTVHYFTQNASAKTGDDDYEAPSPGTLVFDPGETTKTIPVLVIGDTKDEADETFLAKLDNPSHATIAVDEGHGTIRNDDDPPTIGGGNVTQGEGDGGTFPSPMALAAATTTFSFPVTLSAASGKIVTVPYATADGTATVVDHDYVRASGRLTFAPGDRRKTITVLVNGDSKNEAHETFFVNLSSPTNARITAARLTGTITNEDAMPTLGINSVTQAELNSGYHAFTFAATLSAASGKTVTVHYAAANGTAKTLDMPADYAGVPLTLLTFPPGVTSKTFTVLVRGDTKHEANEKFFVRLSSPTNATIAAAQGIGTITNDD